MKVTSNTNDMVRLRDLSTAFSRSVLTDVLMFDDYSHLNWLHSKYRLRSKTYVGLIKSL